MNLDQLELPALEELYRQTALGPMPVGVFRGRLLRYLETPAAKRPLVRGVDWLLFELPAFGIDFDRKRWWFIDSRLGAGRFDVTVGPSRWRETEALRITYDNSRLPRPLRATLYDELKPLADGTCLGLGGINAERGKGEHFFFSLTPITKT